MYTDFDENDDTTNTDYRYTFYCACNYEADKEIDYESCRMDDEDRHRDRVEWEHVMPASYWKRRTHGADCWASNRGEIYKWCDGRSGRKCCGKVNLEFRRLEGDMYNLVPAIGYLNNRRSNYPYTENLDEVKTQYLGCNFQVGKKNNEYMVEPLPPGDNSADADVRGDIARIMFYMRDEHKIPLEDWEETTYTKWNTADMPDAWECEINKRIARVQGNINPYVNKPCKDNDLAHAHAHDEL